MLGASPIAGSPLAGTGFSAHVEIVFFTDTTTNATESLVGEEIPVIRDTAVASFNEVLDTDIVQLVGVFESVIEERIVPLSDGATVSESLFSSLSVDVAATAVASEAADRVTFGSADIRQEGLIRDGTFIGFVATLSAGGVAADGTTDVLVSPAFILEVGRLSEALPTQLLPGNQLSQGATTGENWFSVVLKAATTGDVFAGGQVADLVPVTLVLADTVSVSGVLTSARTDNTILNDLLRDGGVVVGSLSLNQSLNTLIMARGHATATLLLDPRFFEAWVINSDSGAVSRYLNMPFNSAAWFDRRSELLLAKEDGIYVLDADAPDDGGLAIDARVRSGLTDFGTSRLKRVHSANLGLTGHGELVLKAIVSEGGQKAEHWYQIRVNAEAPAEAVIPIGQGLNSRYWGIEIANREGADFELDAIEVYPVGLSRRKTS